MRQVSLVKAQMIIMNNVTVGVCAYNEEKSILKTLCSIVPQLSSKDEVLVVASGCTDKTVDIVKDYVKKDKRVKIIVESERKGKSSAINLILKNAKGKFIVFVDADVLIEKNAIKNLLKRFDKKVGAVVGRTVSFKQENFFDRLQEFAWRTLNEMRAKQSADGKLFALNGYLSAIRNGIVEKIPEDPKKYLIDDWTLGWQIKKKKFKIVFEPEAVVYVKAAQNLSEYMQQKVRNRIGQLQIRKQGMKLSYVRPLSNLVLLFKSPYALPYLILDIVAWVKAWLNLSFGNVQWKTIKSSKI